MAAAVDVILPTHCRPHTLAYAIDAVLQQTHTDFALHVVGDGCDDASAAVVRRVRDARVHFHRFAKARGFGYANRNRVLRATTAPIVAYANDDDLWFPDHLERGHAALEQLGLDLVALRSVHVQVPDLLDPHFFAFDWRAGPLGAFLRNWFLGAGTLLHRRSVFERVGYWNDRLSRFGDREFHNRARLCGLAYDFLDCVTVVRFYAQHWDAHYAGLRAPPQRRYVALLADPAWRERVREAARPGQRDVTIRRRQWADFLRFASRSGPKFVRFWYERTAHAAGTDTTAGVPFPERDA